MKKNDTWQLLINSALEEDIGSGDITSRATIAEGATATAGIFSKQSGILAGIQAAAHSFKTVDDALEYKLFFKDGDPLSPGDRVMKISGKAASILGGERVALNFMSHLSGIATLTKKFVDRIKGTNARIIDTRKTTPLLRALEKQAVRSGGGYNHRMGLYDMVLIKENHIRAAGSIEKAVSQTHRYLNEMNIKAKIEIETTSLDEVREAIKLPVDRIMLDNMPPEEMQTAVTCVAGRIELEASGGVSLVNVREIALTGVNYISVGALTHSFKSFDFSLLIDESK
jgi:nicotinate-nucleotide pyrophosphorylase (carboxylating)